ncbi:hypothetical protein [Streptomyces sp. TRM68367]|uniref:hypothetical protein n=1 Tax=Streptomyces sp. TRM68367 TaxID=2758415 RepID=UPI00165A2AC9|nr:hypothetical protein [Streptomyces sp. TRM68367]MBC9729895.1 hypothetical protein [Streptomyces sp. TRM68367]
MTRALIGAAVLALALAALAALVWWALRGTGRHRAPRRRYLGQTQPGTGLITPYDPEAARLLEAAVEAGEAELLDTDYCPVEDRITPHAVHADGSARCWTCTPETTGNRS